jgi:hypothetical protein
METDPVSKKLCSLVFCRIPDNGQSPKPINPYNSFAAEVDLNHFMFAKLSFTVELYGISIIFPHFLFSSLWLKLNKFDENEVTCVYTIIDH